MLDANELPYRYREYTSEPLSADEIRSVLNKLGAEPTDVLRKNDKAYKALGLTGAEPAGELIRAIAEHPTLLQRPIGIKGKKAVVGRPVERLLELG